mgnify:CR=1 FL=1
MRVDRLKSQREKKKLTHAEFAEMLGVGVRQIARYESGENDPTSEVLARMSGVLGVSADYLLGITDNPTSNFQIDNLTISEKQAIIQWRNGEKYEAIRIIINEDEVKV